MYGIDNNAAVRGSGTTGDELARQGSSPSCAPMGVPATPEAEQLSRILDRASVVSDKPMSGSVRVLLVLAAEYGFDLREGERNSAFVTQFEELADALVHALKTLPSSDGPADYRFLVLKALKAVSALRETVQSQIVDGIEEGADTTVLMAALEDVKKTAVHAAAALEMIEMSITTD